MGVVERVTRGGVGVRPGEAALFLVALAALLAAFCLETEGAADAAVPVEAAVAGVAADGLDELGVPEREINKHDKIIQARRQEGPKMHYLTQPSRHCYCWSWLQRWDKVDYYCSSCRSGAHRRCHGV